MSAVAFAHPQAAPVRTEEPRRLFAVPGGASTAEAVPAPTAAGARPVATLADLVAGRWTAVRAGAAVDCLVCGGRMEPSRSGGHDVAGGRCRDCGTSLD